MLAAFAGDPLHGGTHMFRRLAAITKEKERNQDAQRQFEQAAAQRQANVEQPTAHRFNKTLAGLHQLGAVRREALPILSRRPADTGQFAQPFGRRRWAGIHPAPGGGRQFLDVIAQGSSHDDKRQQDHADHRQGHEQRGESAPPTEQVEQPAIQRPDREA